MIQSAGIALVVKSLLGTSPISSLPYVLSLISPFTFGQTTFAVNMVFVVFELLMLRRDFPAVFWLQIPVTILFGFCIDFFMQLFAIVPEAYALKLLLCLLGTALVALGVAAIVHEADEAPVASGSTVESGDTPCADMPSEENGAESGAEAHLDAEQLQEMTVAQLKELAAELGIETAKLRKKDDLIAAIVAVPVEPGEEISEDDLPDLSAAAPVV